MSNLCLPGVGALRGGLGAQTDVFFQYSLLSQLPTQHQQIRSVLFQKTKQILNIHSAHSSVAPSVAVTHQSVVTHISRYCFTAH